ncbi:hypothetical protein F5Y19DRAFT_292018 [Xylariaceae sp. FL1651]|nr:hypothetical protein F5Y19DRAFT_292018 [Xylariaceae sp. FL1651]
MSWLAPLQTAGALVLRTLQLLGSVIYVLSTPLRWPLYYLYAFVVFLLSPLWAILSLGLGVVSFTVDLIVRLKYLYIYVRSPDSNTKQKSISLCLLHVFTCSLQKCMWLTQIQIQKVACAAIIGICAGCVLYGTSSFVFVMLGLDAASQREKMGHERYQRQLQGLRFPLGDEEDEEHHDELEPRSFSRNSLAKTKLAMSSSSAGWRHFGKVKEDIKIDPNDLFEKRWKSLQTPEPPRRRRKGLLAQTIHEESSESDFS